MSNNWYFVVLFFLAHVSAFAQNDLTITVEKEVTTPYTINPLAPAKAAFYSAVVPGLGQIYNKRYWKVPVVYAAIGTGLYFYIENNKQYNRYRDAYKRRLEGYSDDEFKNIDNSRLITAQRQAQKNKDLSIIITAGLYILNIVDASVDAHLLQFNVNENLSLRPDYYLDNTNYTSNLGLSLNYQF